MPFVLGVTGNIAAGKSTVVRMLAEFGAEVIDADAVYHGLIVPDAPLWQELLDRFGDRILAPDRRIDRRALGGIVFADAAALADLDALTHPTVLAAIDAQVAASTATVVVIDAVKLIESGHADACGRVWLVVSEPARQVERLMRRNGLTRAEAERRVDAQPLLGPKLARADTVIDNNGTIDELHAQAEAAWRALPLVATTS